MSFSFILPTLLGIAVVTAMGTYQWNLRAHIAIPLLTAAMAVAASAASLVVVSTAAAFALGPARSASVTSWCRTIPLHHEVKPLIGFGAIGLTAYLALRCSRVLVPRHRAIRAAQTSGRISILQTPSRIAYAVPTKQGCVVVSTGLLESLTAPERRAVFAHERAHLRLGHHRYLLAAELSRAVLPFLDPLALQVRHATERAADEAAAVAIQDRRIVARAIATTALGPQVPSLSLPALGGGSVTRRVEALLWPDSERVASRSAHTVAFASGAAAVAALAIQMHHFSTIIDHLCRGVS